MRFDALILAVAAAQPATALSIPSSQVGDTLQPESPSTRPTRGESRGFVNSEHGSFSSSISKHAHSIPSSSHSAPQIIPLRRPKNRGTNAKRPLTGKFLHITDIHPDPYYKAHSSTLDDALCHRGKGPAGFYGAETSSCDSPYSLVNATFDWLKANLRDEIDFIIWTGDSARHDNDEDIPRSRTQIIEQNSYVVKKFLDAFGKPENWDDDDPLNDFVVPIVPTLGNNDILPHNIFDKGPNYWSKRYLDLWRQFIPEEERHQFQRGGWFNVEVVPGKLTVFSLNTLYFFTSNSAVDGCAEKKEPGYEQFEWLRIQLDLLRARGMKAILMGHVPPARVEHKTSWEETCWQKYALWMHQYRDIIVAGLYGHMNIDHFILQDFETVKKHVRNGIQYGEDDDPIAGTDSSDESFGIQSAQDYLQDLRGIFAQIPKIDNKARSNVGRKDKKKKGKKDPSDLVKIGGLYGERYSLTLVAPSVVPNYFPTIRVYCYNISGVEGLEQPDALASMAESHSYSLHSQTPLRVESKSSEVLDAPDVSHPEIEDDESPPSHSSPSRSIIEKAKKHKHKPPKKLKFRVPTGPSKTAPPGPAYSIQPFTILGYKQYYANLTYINNDFTRDDDDGEDDAEIGAWDRIFHGLKWKKGKHHKKEPKHDIPQPNNFTFELEYDTMGDKVYKLQDLTVRNMLDLAARIAGKKDGKGKKNSIIDDVYADAGKKNKKNKKNIKKHDKEWFTFVTRAFVGTIDPGDIEDIYA